jgi:hypothetical protein
LRPAAVSSTTCVWRGGRGCRRWAAEGVSCEGAHHRARAAQRSRKGLHTQAVRRKVRGATELQRVEQQAEDLRAAELPLPPPPPRPPHTQFNPPTTHTRARTHTMTAGLHPCTDADLVWRVVEADPRQRLFAQVQGVVVSKAAQHRPLSRGWGHG